MEEILTVLFQQSAGLVVAVMVIWKLDTTMTSMTRQIDTLIKMLQDNPPHSH